MVKELTTNQQADNKRELKNWEIWLDWPKKNTSTCSNWFHRHLKIYISIELIRKRSKLNFYRQLMIILIKKFKQSQVGNKMNSIRLQLITITTTTKIKILSDRKIRGLIKHLICRSLWAKLVQLWINALPKVKIWVS